MVEIRLGKMEYKCKLIYGIKVSDNKCKCDLGESFKMRLLIDQSHLNRTDAFLICSQSRCIFIYESILPSFFSEHLFIH